MHKFSSTSALIINNKNQKNLFRNDVNFNRKVCDFDNKCLTLHYKIKDAMIRKAIRQKLEDTGTRQTAFCKVIGVAASNFNAFLNGSRTLSYPKLIKALEELGLSVGLKAAGRAVLPPSELPEIFKSYYSVSGMKVKEVAEKTNIDNTCLTAFFNGYRTMSIRNIEKVMALFHLDVVEYINPKKKTA